MTKKQVRALARARWAACTPQQLHAWGVQMAAQAAALDAWRAAPAVFCFASLPTEPDTLPLLRAALQAGKTLYLPRVAGHRMETVPVREPAALRPGAFGIPEPPGPAGALPPGTLAVVPCLAVSGSGVRLGRGGGFYDRFLAGFTGPRLLLCPRALLFAELPRDAWDVCFAPGEILTEDGLLG